MPDLKVAFFLGLIYGAAGMGFIAGIADDYHANRIGKMFIKLMMMLLFAVMIFEFFDYQMQIMRFIVELF